MQWHYFAAIAGVSRAGRCWRSRPPTSTRCRRSAATRSSTSGSPRRGRWCSSSSSACRSSPRPATCSRASGSAASTSAAWSALLVFAPRCCSCWCGAGRAKAASTRRTVIVGGGEPASALIEALAEQKRLRRRDHRPVRRPRRRPLAARDCAGERKLGTVDDLVEFARRTRVDLVIFSLPITAEEPHPADAEEAVGAAGRHPALGAHQQAALPPALLFLSSATCRCSTCSTGRSPTGTW